MGIWSDFIRSRTGMVLALLLITLSHRAIASSGTTCPASSPCTEQGAATALDSARAWAQHAQRARRDHTAVEAWVRCATDAYRALDADDAAVRDSASALATACTTGFLLRHTGGSPHTFSQGATTFGATTLDVEFRGLSPSLQPPLRVILADRVPLQLYGGERHVQPGFGVPLAVLTPRCTQAPLCQLLPPEGVFRGATAWIEGDGSDRPHLVFGNPLTTPALIRGRHAYPLAIDTSAPYAWGARKSKLNRLGILGLFGGKEIGRRAGLYLLEDYDPHKQPLVMIHGLGSSPLVWARLSNAVWGDPDLRRRFQVWHLVYRTNAPLLVTRRRVQTYLDDAWRILDPEGDDPARSGVVLVGHSLGGVVARLLCVDSGDLLWNAAFLAPFRNLQGDANDLWTVDQAFHFNAYPGVRRAIFMAAPHRGSPTTTRWFGRLARVIVGRQIPEIQALRRVARRNPEAVRPELRSTYQRGTVNSISTLQGTQPVRHAGEALMPIAGIPYHTIAGSLPGRPTPTDGVVPLQSAYLDGAASTLVVPFGHDLQQAPEAIQEVLRILRLEAGEHPPLVEPTNSRSQEEIHGRAVPSDQ